MSEHLTAGCISFGERHKIISSTYQVMVRFEFINILYCQKVGHLRCFFFFSGSKHQRKSYKKKVQFMIRINHKT